MASVKRSRVLQVAPAVAWRTVADPRTQPRWWPDVERVESVKPQRFTQVLRSSRGAVVRADFLRAESIEPQRVRWEQRLDGTPFSSVFAERAITITLEPVQQGGTEVTVAVSQRLRGAARFAPLNRGGVRRQLDAALDGLEELLSA